MLYVVVFVFLIGVMLIVMRCIVFFVCIVVVLVGLLVMVNNVKYELLCELFVFMDLSLFS